MVSFLCSTRSCVLAKLKLWAYGTIDMVSDCSWLGLGTFLLQPLWVVVMTSDVGLKSFALMASRKITPAYLKSLWKTMQRRMMAAVDDQKGHRKC